MTLPIIAGILASMLHVISGPDHLAAVTPLVVEYPKRVWRIGLVWGIGHLTGMLLIGVLYFLLKNILPVEFISEFSGRSEQIVGVVLLGLGVWVFYRVFREPKQHRHPHIHQEEESYMHIHSHNHDHSHPTHDHTHEHKIKQNLLASFSIGVLHGFAGLS